MYRSCIYLALIQHDEIRNEVRSQGGLPLLIRCATENKFNVLTIQQRALEILLLMTFDDSSLKFLEQNKTLKDYLRTIGKSNIPKEREDLMRATQGLLWKLEKEEPSTTEKTSTSTAATDFDERDIMISYSHEDKNLCHQICQYLKNDRFSVWIDTEQMCTETTEQMAKAIIQSKFILFCMSETYQASGYCKLEAHYAFKHKRFIIPLIVAEKYKPSGWLDFLIGGKKYIDFTKSSFDAAYYDLKSAIQQYRDAGLNKNNIKSKEQSSKTEPNTRAIDKSQMKKVDMTSANTHT